MVDGAEPASPRVRQIDRQPRRPEHARGRHGRHDDRRADARPASASRTTAPAARRSISSCCRSRRCSAGRTQTARRRSDRCSWRPTSAPTATRSRRACCRTWRRRAGSAIPTWRGSRCSRDAAAQRLQPHLRRRVADRDERARRCSRKSRASSTIMRGDLARMQTLVPASEKDRLTAHAEAIDQLETSLRRCTATTVTAGGLREADGAAELLEHQQRASRAPAASTATWAASTTTSPDAPTSHPHLDLGQAQLRLIKAAFACDLVPRRDVHVVGGNELGRLPGTFQGATIAGQSAVDAAPPAQPQRADAATQRLAESDRSVLFGGDRDGAAGVRHRRPTSTATC